MDRRLVGALLVVAVFAVAVVVPLLGGRRITGLAEPVTVPRDPRMGDCLLQQPESVEPALSQPVAGLGVGTTDPPAVSLPLGPTVVRCDKSPVASEVVLTVTAAGDLGTRQRSVAATGIDCHAAALRYAGLTRSAGGFRPVTVTPRQAADDPVAWDVSINVRTAWVYPSSFLRSVGRTWAACVVVPSSDESYRGSLADAFGSGSLPDQYGTCWSSAVVSAATQITSCHQRHLAELISFGSVTAGIRTPDLQASCRRLAAITLGRSDPTAGGTLSVRTSPADLYVPDEMRPTGVMCYVASAGPPLSGTLMGLHDMPVPFAS